MTFTQDDRRDKIRSQLQYEITHPTIFYEISKIRRDKLENGLCNPYPTSQSKSKMEKELNNFVLNPEVPDTNNDHRSLYLQYHPEEVLTQDDCIHHINGNHDDNRKENLVKLTQKEHRIAHAKMWKEEQKNQ
jgi:hypothetical protein